MTVAIVAAVVSVVSAVAGAISGADKDAAIDALNEHSSQTSASASNAARQASNANIAAQNNLKRFIQNTNNQRRLDAGGAQLGTSVTNYLRTRDQLTRGTFEQSIQAAESLGSQAASAASSGITGSVVDNINSATILRNDRMAGEVQKQGSALAQDYSSRQSAIVQNTVNGLDNKSIYDNFDNNINVAMKYASPTWFGRFLGGGGGSQLIGAGQALYQSNGNSTGGSQIGAANTTSADKAGMYSDSGYGDTGGWGGGGGGYSADMGLGDI